MDSRDKLEGQIEMKRINCLGIIVMDALSGPLSSYPVPRVCTQVTTDSIRFQPGGGAANSAAALAQMGIPVSLFSKIGADLIGSLVCGELERCGVNVSGVIKSPADTTPFTFVGLHADGDRTFVHTPGANKTLCLADFNEDRLLDADCLFCQDYWGAPGMEGLPVANLLEKARRRGMVTLLDECWGFGPDRDSLEAVLPFVDYFLPSVDDMGAIFPGLQPFAIISRLHQLGAAHVVLKMGRDGCLVSTGSSPVSVPSHAVKIVDTTGAGDCFDAGFIAGILHGLSDQESALIGSHAAAACIAHVGGASGIPKFHQLQTEAGRKAS
ncbi:MAG: sugar kinase [Verrucomicrobia bacterium]|nr:sugar kinase [Verrucomicrobiota bacterium]